MNKNYSIVAVLCLSGALCFDASFVYSEDKDISKMQDLATKADREGSVRVIIQLKRQNPQDDTNDVSPTQTKESVERIQNEVISDLGSRAGNQPNVIHKYQFSPTVVLDLDKKGIEFLSQDDRVKNIVEDRPVSPFSSP